MRRLCLWLAWHLCPDGCTISRERPFVNATGTFTTTATDSTFYVWASAGRFE